MYKIKVTFCLINLWRLVIVFTSHNQFQNKYLLINFYTQFYIWQNRNFFYISNTFIESM